MMESQTTPVPAILVADHFVSKLRDEQQSVSVPKLQHLLYYAQGQSLATQQRPLFREAIHATSTGVRVLPEALLEGLIDAHQHPAKVTWFNRLMAHPGQQALPRGKAYQALTALSQAQLELLATRGAPAATRYEY